MKYDPHRLLGSKRIHRMQIEAPVWDELVAAYGVREFTRSRTQLGQSYLGIGLMLRLMGTAYECDEERVERADLRESVEDEATYQRRLDERRAAEARSDQWVYFARCSASKRIKIGWTRKTPEERLRDIQAPAPIELLLAIHGTRETEQRMHEHFAADRLHNEWFRASKHLMDFINAAKVTA